MDLNYLILFAPDGEKYALDIKEKFKPFGLSVSTLTDYQNSVGINIPEAELCQYGLECFDVIICVVTPGLFANCHLASTVRCAIGLGKLISAHPVGLNVITPSWF